MRTLYPVIVAVSIAVAVLMVQMSGLPSILMGGDQGQQIAADEGFKNRAENTSLAVNLSSKNPAEQHTGTVANIANSLAAVLRFAEMVLFLPNMLMALRFPPYFALPMGALGQIIATIGLAQAVVNRFWR